MSRDRLNDGVCAVGCACYFLRYVQIFLCNVITDLRAAQNARFPALLFLQLDASISCLLSFLRCFLSVFCLLLLLESGGVGQEVIHHFFCPLVPSRFQDVRSPNTGV